MGLIKINVRNSELNAEGKVVDLLPAPRLVGKNVASPTILNFVPQILDVT